MNKLNIKRKRTTAFHPACNGAVERFHRTLKSALRAHCSTQTWYTALPLALLGIRSAIDKQGLSSANLLYGTSLELPTTIFVPNEPQITSPSAEFLKNLTTLVKTFPQPVRTFKSPVYLPKELRNSEFVLLREISPQNSLSDRYSGPYKVENQDDKTVTIHIHGRTEKISVDRVKPAFVLSETENSHAESEQPEKHVSPTEPTPIAPTPIQNKIGDVIFANWPGYPIWPAKIISSANSPLEGQKQPKNSTPIQFFGTDRFAYIENCKISKYDKIESKHRGQLRAIKLAEEYLRNRALVSAIKKIRGVRINLTPEVRFI